MAIFVIGVNHKTATVGVREKVYFALENLALYLQDLLSQRAVQEAVILSTCNRSELYCEADSLNGAYEWFYAQTALTPDELANAIYVYRGEGAVQHIMEVACGLDSMVLGEPQILGQMKDAYTESCALGAVGPCFHRLFQQVFTVAKEIRATTAIGACPVSVASAAVNFAKQQTAQFGAANVLILGAGDTTTLLLRYLQEQVDKPITVLNRTIDKAIATVAPFNGVGAGFDNLASALMAADVVFSATGSPLPIVTKALLADVIHSRENKPLTFIDIAVPRDIDPQVAELPQINLYCIDDLKTIIEHNRQGREHAAIKARDMITCRAKRFCLEHQMVDEVSHTIRAYRQQIEALCQNELTKAMQQLQLGGDPHLILPAFANSFMNKVLHQPSAQLRQAGADNRPELLQLAKQLFSLPELNAEEL